MGKYVTRQRKILLDYLADHPDESLSAIQIASALTEQGISTSAVYRNLSALEEEGLLRKLGIGDGGEICYQYIGAKLCQRSLHFSCTTCKKTSHIKEETAARLLSLLEEDGCCLSMSQTILYGTCKDCQ